MRGILIKVMMMLFFNLFFIETGKAQIEYRIEGSAIACQNSVAYLVLLNNNQIIDSAFVSDERFYFEGQQSIPYYAAIRINGYKSPYLILENGLIEVSMTNDFSTVRGTVTNEKFNFCWQKLDSLTNPIYKEIKNMPRNIEEREEKRAKYYAEITSKKDSLIKTFVFQNLDNIIPAFFIFAYREKFSDLEIENIRNASSPILQNNPLMMKVINSSVNSYFRDIALQNMNGEDKLLSDWLDKEHYVLLNIWASWCTPCIAELPLIKKLRLKYMLKLKVLNVSIDHDKEIWLKAVKQYNVPNINLRAEKISLMTNYCFHSIPALILISPNGTIIARSKSLEKIEQILSKDLKRIGYSN